MPFLVMLSATEGAQAVALARASMMQALRPAPAPAAPPGEGSPLPPVFDELRGVFVTLRRHPGGRLRGCIGYPLPVLPLRAALREAAVSAAMEDPRFPPIRAPELASLTVEVSVLTLPVPLTAERPEGLLQQIRVGRDGLIVEGYGTSGLLLPQVGPEQGWSSEELIDGTCEKAGLRPGAWRDPRVTVRRFEAEVFGERSPSGEVVRQVA
jgi:uncharacterized protein